MKEPKYNIVWSTQFKKDYKRSMKRHLDISLLDDIIRKLSKGVVVKHFCNTLT